jgi:hypothetical protein
MVLWTGEPNRVEIVRPMVDYVKRIRSKVGT